MNIEFSVIGAEEREDLLQQESTEGERVGESMWGEKGWRRLAEQGARSTYPLCQNSHRNWHH